jgi:hypothetical protein
LALAFPFADASICSRSSTGESQMTPEEQEKLDLLCIAIKAEKNSAKLVDLTKELNEFLQEREHILKEQQCNKEFL